MVDVFFFRSVEKQSLFLVLSVRVCRNLGSEKKEGGEKL